MRFLENHQPKKKMKLFDNDNIFLFDRLDSNHAEVNVMIGYYNIKRAITYITLVHMFFFANFGQYDNIYGWTLFMWIAPPGYFIEFFIFLTLSEMRGSRK